MKLSNSMATDSVGIPAANDEEVWGRALVRAAPKTYTADFSSSQQHLHLRSPSSQVPLFQQPPDTSHLLTQDPDAVWAAPDAAGDIPGLRVKAASPDAHKL